MKAVYTFFMITVSISLMLFLVGGLDSSGNTIMPVILNILQGNNVSSSTLWLQLAIFVGAILGAAGLNTITGGSSGAAITIGKGAFIYWMINFVGDYVALIAMVKPTDLATGGLDTVIYYITFVIGGLLAIGFVYSLIDLLFEND